MSTILSDGEVNHDWMPNVPPEHRSRYSYVWGHGVGAKDTRQAVRNGERLGVTVIGVSIGPTWGYMEQVRPRRICCTDIRELPDALAHILGQVMLNRLKAHGRAGNRPALSCLAKAVSPPQ